MYLGPGYIGPYYQVNNYSTYEIYLLAHDESVANIRPRVKRKSLGNSRTYAGGRGWEGSRSAGWSGVVVCLRPDRRGRPMSWVKLDDAILDNPKIVAAGPIGLLLHVAAITWCGRNLTDGLIPKRKVCSLLHLGGIETAIAAPPACGPEEDTFSQIDADEVADELAKIGLWHDRGFYWEIHDYLVYNPSREKVLADRERARTKKAQQRMSPDVSPGDNHGDMHGSPDPVPVYPVPVPVPEPVPEVREKETRYRSQRKVRQTLSHAP